ncbi:MAG: TRAP transporter large permease [Pseudomonadota bacterium]
MIATLLVVPVALFLLGFPIWVVLLAASTATVLFVVNVPPLIIHQVMYGAVDQYALLAIPFFLFAGELMGRCGVSARLVVWSQSLLGGIRGALGLTTICTSTLLGAVSGSSPATVAATGRILYGDLLKDGYSKRFSLGLIASSGSVAIVIPPSIAMILYGASAEQSVPKLFIAGILPGLLISVVMAVFVLIWVRRKAERGAVGPAGQRVRDAEGGTMPLARATVHASGALAMPVIVLMGIYLGYFSPTEAGGVACLYAILLARFAYRSLSWGEILEAASDSAVLTGQILIILSCAAVFSWLLTVQGIPQALVAWVEQAELSRFTFLLAINVLLLALGCVIDPTSAILVLTPILLPIVLELGIDPIHFGIVMTVNLSIGMFTPPFGLNLFVAQSVMTADLTDLYKGVFGFFVVQTVALLAITYLPGLSLWLVG